MTLDLRAMGNYLNLLFYKCPFLGHGWAAGMIFMIESDKEGRFLRWNVDMTRWEGKYVRTERGKRISDIEYQIAFTRGLDLGGSWPFICNT
jgi:hypothetical protein